MREKIIFMFGMFVGSIRGCWEEKSREIGFNRSAWPISFHTAFSSFQPSRSSISRVVQQMQSERGRIPNRTITLSITNTSRGTNSLGAKLFLHHVIQIGESVGALHIIVLAIDERAHNRSHNGAEQKLALLISKIHSPSAPLATLGNDYTRILSINNPTQHVHQDCSKTCTSSNASSSLPP